MNLEAKNKNREEREQKIKNLNLVSLALELGFLIAIPIVGLALLGRFADRYFNTSPYLLLAGILVSFFFSVVLMYRKVKDVIG